MTKKKKEEINEEIINEENNEGKPRSPLLLRIFVICLAVTALGLIIDSEILYSVGMYVGLFCLIALIIGMVF